MRRLTTWTGIALTAVLVALTGLAQENDEPKAKLPEKKRDVPPASQELLRAANATEVKALEEIYRELATPHDRVALDDKVGELKIIPLPIYSHQQPMKMPTPVVLVPIDPTEKVRTFDAGDLNNIVIMQCYENHALEELDNLFRKEAGIPRVVKLETKEKILSVVIRYHVSQQGPNGVRQHSSWNEIRAKIDGELGDVRMELIGVKLEAKDWKGCLTLLESFIEQYPNPKNGDRVSKLVGNFVEGAWNSPEGNARELIVRLRDLYEQRPKHPVFVSLPEKLEAKARLLYEEGKTLEKSDKAKAIAKWDLGRAIWPDLQEWRSGTLQSATIPEGTLVVGTRTLPAVFSPALASTEIERQCLDLLFESLLDLSVDPKTGHTRYQPELAVALPTVLSVGPRNLPSRKFTLSPQALWSDGTRFSPLDVRFTVSLLREGYGRYQRDVWQNVLDEVKWGGEPNLVTLSMVRGSVDPLAWMTFKIVPQAGDVKGSTFATKPIGSGPYRLTEFNAEAKKVVFEANPYYSKRPGNLGQPNIGKIEFRQLDDPGVALASGEVNFAWDLTGKELAELKKVNTAGKQIEIPQPEHDVAQQRIFYLAVNHRNPILANRDVRLALASAIDRTKLLDAHFRDGSLPVLHSPLSQPYPVGSWAEALTDKPVRDASKDPLHDAAAAAGRFQTGMKSLTRDAANLRLVYPEGNPALAEAMTALKAQLESTLGKGGPSLTIELIPTKPSEMWHTLHKTRQFDLAYTSYTFPDQTYWLGPILGTTGADEDNVLEYQNADLLADLLQVRDHREFEEIRDLTKKIATKVSLDLPVVPLWQLDPLHAWQKNVKPVGFHPEKVFAEIGRWTMKGKKR